MTARTGKFSMPRCLGKFRVLLAAILACRAASVAVAAGGPENALVVVNADSWASTYIANEYIAATNRGQEK